MTADVALLSFFRGFGIPAYPDTAIPAGAAYPYLAYSPRFDVIGHPVSISVNVWYNVAGESPPNKKAMEIVAALPAAVHYDGGTIWMQRGHPAWQPLDNGLAAGTPNSATIKRRLINIEAEFITL